MKILLVADNEETCLWGEWSEEMARKLSGVDIILSAGDLSTYYLEFLTGKLNVPLVYVPGNHDDRYMDNPPKRCINTDGRITRISLHHNEGPRHVTILGLGGSMRYKPGPYQYSEEEQAGRAWRLLQNLDVGETAEKNSFNILLTHSPCRGYGDMKDIPHRGFNCFNELLHRWKPQLHCYGHVHAGYGNLSEQTSKDIGFQRVIAHPAGTNLVNGSGHCFIEI